MSVRDRFMALEQGRSPRPVASMLRQYRTPPFVDPNTGLTISPVPAGARLKPEPPMMRPESPTLSPLMREVLRQSQMKKAQEAQQAASGMPMPGVLPMSKPTPPPSQPSGFMGAFSQPLTSPVGQAISQAAIAGARASDWSPTPVSLGRVLAEMGAAASQGYAGGLKEQRAQEAADFARRMQLMQFAQKEREIAGTSGKEERAITKEQFDMEDKLFNKYEDFSSKNREAFFGYLKVKNAAEAQKAATARGEEPSGASDIALLIGYMKTLDPGSVVRETEYATAKNAGGVSERVRNIFNNVQNGVILTPKLREEFIKSATTQVQPHIKRQIELDEQYTRRANDYNLNPKRVVTSFLPNIYNSVDDAEKANLPVGSLVIIKDRLAVIE
jgi:hypothetical protein